jgi:hypothetical protein
LWGSGIKQGLSFTTTARQALTYESYPFLFKTLAQDVGVLGVIAVVGAAVLLARGDRRSTALSMVCLTAGLALPLSQIRIHEFVSLDKHTAFAALFFSFPAAVALDWAFTRAVRIKVIALVLVWILLLNGLWRSDIQYYWPSSIMKTVHAVERNPVPGLYLSFDASTYQYYMQNYPEVKWQTAYGLFDAGTAAVLAAERSHRYAGFVYETGNEHAANLATQRQLGYALGRDRYYYLVATYRVDPYHKTEWYVWQHVTAGSG